MNLNPNTSLALMQASQVKTNNTVSQTKEASSLKDKDLAKINDAAEDFEAMFVTEMMKPMFEGLKPDAMFGGGKSEEIFNGMMLEEYGKMMAHTGQLGIADVVKKEMIRMQEAANNPSSDAPQNATN